MFFLYASGLRFTLEFVPLYHHNKNAHSENKQDSSFSVSMVTASSHICHTGAVACFIISFICLFVFIRAHMYNINQPNDKHMPKPYLNWTSFPPKEVCIINSYLYIVYLFIIYTCVD